MVKKQSPPMKEMIDISILENVLKEYEKQSASMAVGMAHDLALSLGDKMIESTDEIFEWGMPTSITGKSSGYLPRGVKFAFQRGQSVTFVIEQEPQIRTVHFSKEFVREHFFGDTYPIPRLVACRVLFKDKTKPRLKRHFRLAFPYVIFVVTIKDIENPDCWMFFSNEPLVSLKQKVFVACLPNVYNNGDTCTDQPTDNFWGKKEKGQYGLAAEEVIEDFWRNTFNTDVTDWFLQTRHKDKRLGSLWHWEENSRKDSRFILTVKWLKADLESKDLRSNIIDILESLCLPKNYLVHEMIEEEYSEKLIREKAGKEIGQVFQRLRRDIDEKLVLIENGNTEERISEPVAYSRNGSGQTKERRRK